ncbi:O-antigen polymerase [Acinetobacter johnsonii]|uniref:O-antigen polymerase n=1 Tax=Acinetobacter johnsonii TaxID=40214 RepID=UPI0011E61F97|nr:O-antigen polymerase [Acinetobacter johnsonii]QEK37238.1 oligosaccharide repeat unit polymerase [Acinetobacter johnsonii]
MKFILFFLNIFLIFSSFLFSNDFLIYNGWIIYFFQFFFNFLFLITKVDSLTDLFMPSFIFLVYLFLGQVVGGYLSPLGYGWYGEFDKALSTVDNMNIIVFYNLIINYILFFLTNIFLTKTNYTIYYLKSRSYFFSVCLIISIFIFVSFFRGVWTFPIQLASFIILYLISLNKSYLVKVMSILLFFFVMITTSYDSKREIIMVLVVFLLITLMYKKYHLNFKTILLAPLAFIAFSLTILLSSILRGYGDLDNRSFLSALQYIPTYISSENFLDNLVENFELNYSYSLPVLAMDYVLNGKIDFQYGLSLIKPLFLIIPREIFDVKPESIIFTFTKAYDYNFYQNGGSLPVLLPAELFINFYMFGVIAFLLIMYFLNSIYRKIFFFKSVFSFIVCIFICGLFLMFMRGSGFDLFILYIALGCLYSYLMCILLKIQIQK